MTIYSPYGLRYFDSYTTASAVSEIDIDINDNSPTTTTPFDIVQIAGSLKFTDETQQTGGAQPIFEFKTNDGTAQGVHYATARATSTSRLGVYGTTANTTLKLTNGINVGTYTPAPTAGSNVVEQFNFNMLLKLSRSSSAPISRVNGWFDSSYQYVDGLSQLSLGGFYIYNDSNIFTVTISSLATTVMGDINVYGFCGDSAD